MNGENVPDDRRYTKSHEWVKIEGSDLVIGITDHAQSELTDIVFVELPKVGKAVNAGESVLILESVKTVADVYAPAAGSISAVNESLKKSPDLVNKEPYGGGWLYRLSAGTAAAPQGLMSAAEYRAFVSSAGGH